MTEIIEMDATLEDVLKQIIKCAWGVRSHLDLVLEFIKDCCDFVPCAVLHKDALFASSFFFSLLRFSQGLGSPRIQGLLDWT